MPSIRNLSLIKRFTDYFRLKHTDMLDSEAGRMLVPVVSIPVPPKIVDVIDVIANDSNKQLTVPDGKQWKLLYGSFFIITTASAGNRQMRINIKDVAGNSIYTVLAANVQVASTTEIYSLGQFANVSETVAGFHLLPIPVNLILDPGYAIQILDSAAIAATADDLTIRLVVEETDKEDL